MNKHDTRYSQSTFEHTCEQR